MLGNPFTTLTPGALTICTYTEFAPFAHEVAGQIVGTDITLLRHFAQQYGLAVRLLKKSSFANLWHAPGAGECDIAAAGIAALAERDLGCAAVWSIPYLTVRRSLLIRKGDAGRLRFPADFAHQKIVVTPDSTADMDAQQRYAPLGAQIIRHVPSQQAVVHALLNQEVDLSSCHLLIFSPIGVLCYVSRNLKASAMSPSKKFLSLNAAPAMFWSKIR